MEAKTKSEAVTKGKRLQTNTGETISKATRRRRFAKNYLDNGGKIFPAMVEAGFSPKQAKKGRSAVERYGLTKEIMHECKRRGIDFAEVGTQFMDRDYAEKVIMGRLGTNVLMGISDGNEAASLLGKTKKLDLFAKECREAQIVLAIPESLVESFNKTPKLDLPPEE